MGEVLEHEGWMMKRGAGYRKQSSNDFTQSQKSLGSPKIRLGMLRAKSSQKIASTLGRSFKGKQEKRRYFRLIKSISPPRGVLIYYTSDDVSREVGRIIFDATDSVKVDGNMIELTVGKRTYFLRPTGELEDLEDDVEHLALLQWKHAIETVLLASVPLVTLVKNRSINTEVESERPLVASFYSEVDSEFDSTLVTVSAKHLISKNISKKDCYANYEDVYDKFGFVGFKQIVSHFGAVETDITRLRNNLKNKIKNLEEAGGIMKELRNVATEPVLSSQPTVYKAYRRLYEQDKKSVDINKAILNNYEKILMVFESDMSECREKLVKVRKKEENLIEELTKRKSAMSRASEKLKQAIKEYENAKIVLKEGKSNGEEDEMSVSQNGTKFFHILRRVKGKFGGSVKEGSPEEDVDELGKEVGVWRRTKSELSEKFYVLEKEGSVSLKVVLNEFQKIEEDRIEFQKKMLERVGEEDVRYYMALLSDYWREEGEGDTVVETIDAIVAEEDMKYLSGSIASQAKEVTEQKKNMRKKKIRY